MAWEGLSRVRLERTVILQTKKVECYLLFFSWIVDSKNPMVGADISSLTERERMTRSLEDDAEKTVIDDIMLEVNCLHWRIILSF